MQELPYMICSQERRVKFACKSVPCTSHFQSWRKKPLGAWFLLSGRQLMHRFVPCFFIILILTVDQSTWDAHFAWIDYIILVSWSVKQIKTRETMECFCSLSYWVCFFSHKNRRYRVSIFLNMIIKIELLFK